MNLPEQNQTVRGVPTFVVVEILMVAVLMLAISFVVLHIRGITQQDAPSEYTVNGLTLSERSSILDDLKVQVSEKNGQLTHSEKLDTMASLQDIGAFEVQHSEAVNEDEREFREEIQSFLREFTSIEHDERYDDSREGAQREIDN